MTIQVYNMYSIARKPYDCGNLSLIRINFAVVYRFSIFTAHQLHKVDSGCNSSDIWKTPYRDFPSVSEDEDRTEKQAALAF